MGEKKKDKNERIVPIWMFFIWAIVFLICCLIIGTYVYTMGFSVSRNSGNWGDFGSLLSGTFGMLASFTALGALIAVFIQLRHQSEITEKQIESIEFDRYDRHRRIFFERLSGIEQTHDRTLLIQYQEELYKRVFPLNSPLKCEVKINLDEQKEERKSRVIQYKKIFERIKENIDKSKDINEHVIWELFDLQRRLGIIRCGKMELGDVSLEGERTIINIYEITSSMYRLWSVINNILEYGGNEPIAGQHYVVLIDEEITSSTVKTAIRMRENQGRGRGWFKISTDNNKPFLIYERIYLWLIGIHENNNIFWVENLKNKIRDILFDEDGMRAIYTGQSEKMKEIVIALQENKEIINTADENENQMRLEFIAELERQVDLLSAQGL
ncbi:hypothetical protein HOP61_19705 [Halomonas daqingensis]|uniref:Uncharacterized protein n=1 Tax=Billgrantia desiderata TaxID=52021 RepID=A0AAW4Z308_9GAMM|nr:hypothetical protein [Halomonas desiderata]MCE8053523.1 hypothetical protein [Halomonas desiderata]